MHNCLPNGKSVAQKYFCKYQNLQHRIFVVNTRTHDKNLSTEDGLVALSRF